MQIITLILSILALLLAGVALVMIAREKRRNQHRFEENRNGNKALRKVLIDYVSQEIDAAVDGISSGVRESMDKVNSRIDKTNKAVRAVNMKADAVKKAVQANKGRIDDLEQGVVPDFEAAQKAVNAVNDVNKGIAGILGFDPLEALKQSRQEAD